MKPKSEAARAYGQVLRYARTFRPEPLRQTELARELGISASAVSQAENGDRPPREDSIPAWAAALGAPEGPLVALYFLAQGLVPRDGDVCWYVDLWSDEQTGRKSPHDFLGHEMQAPLMAVLEAVAMAPARSDEFKSRVKVEGPRWEEASDDRDEAYHPEFLALGVTWVSMIRHGSQWAPHNSASATLEIPEPRAVPNRRRERRIVAQGDRLASRVAELTPRQRELALAYIDGLLDGGT